MTEVCLPQLLCRHWNLIHFTFGMSHCYLKHFTIVQNHNYFFSHYRYYKNTPGLDSSSSCVVIRHWNLIHFTFGMSHCYLKHFTIVQNHNYFFSHYRYYKNTPGLDSSSSCVVIRHWNLIHFTFGMSHCYLKHFTIVQNHNYFFSHYRYYKNTPGLDSSSSCVVIRPYV